MKQFDKTSYIYTPLFCEENIWKLLNTLYTNQYAKPIDVLFILNQSSTVALFSQNKSEEHKPVIWDYHVILTAELDNEIVVFDFDSKCNFPVKIIDYFKATFPANIQLSETYQPLIKAINPQYYHQHFYSDRSHMINIIDKSEFPDYEIIKPFLAVDNLTLDTCIDIKASLSQSTVILPELYLSKFKTQTPE